MSTEKVLSPEEKSSLIEILRERFEKNPGRHPEYNWDDVLNRLSLDNAKLWSLNQMERSGGEPDVIGKDETSGEFIFVDCAAESPKGRRSICYDVEALESRKEHKPAHSALGMATEMGIQILTESQYRDLQKLGKFDTKTSSWIETPEEIRRLGGALFGDYRYGTVFTYHNGAESYYGARGFRGSLKV